jgi:hypothetical protein
LAQARLSEYALWCESAARRQAQWAESHLAALFDAGRPGPPCSDGYAAVLASASLGSPATAAYLMASVAERWLVSPGEFHPLDEPEHLRRRSFLRNSTLLLAASRLGRADLLTEAAVGRLFAYQHRSGGFFDMDPAQGHGLVEAFTTSWGGRLAIRIGRLDVARRAAHLVADIVYSQPDPEGRFYFCYETLPAAVVTRWHVGEHQARYVDFADRGGETHQLGATLALLAEMHLAEPAAGWERPLQTALRLAERLSRGLLRQPALATVADGLAIAAWSLGRAGEALEPLLLASLAGLAAAAPPSTLLPPWEAGDGAAYGRAFSALETAGWSAIFLASLSQALLNTSW